MTASHAVKPPVVQANFAHFGKYAGWFILWVMRAHRFHAARQCNSAAQPFGKLQPSRQQQLNRMCGCIVHTLISFTLSWHFSIRDVNKVSLKSES